MSAQSVSENKKSYDILYYTAVTDTGADTTKIKIILIYDIITLNAFLPMQNESVRK